MLFVKNLLGSVLSTVEYSVLGDIREVYRIGVNSLLQKRAKVDPQGVGTVRLGPAYFGRHLVLFLGKGKLETVKQQLATVMDLPDPHARDPYFIFNYVTGANFFLSMTGPKAIELRKKVLPYLAPQYFIENASSFCDKLMEEYYRYAPNTNNFQKTQILLYQLFARRILGLELNEEMLEVLNELNMIPSINTMLPPAILLRFNSQIKQLKSKINRVFLAFLQENIQEIRAQFDSKNPSLLITLIREALPPEYTPEDITNEDLARLSQDATIRVSFALLMPVKNIASVLVEGFEEIAKDPALAQLLRDELSEQKMGDSVFSTPQLDKFYAQTLSRDAPAAFILRYSAKGFKRTDENPMSIPPNATIIYQLTDLPPGEILQFGLKSRRCPAFSVASALTKLLFKEFLKRDVCAFDLFTIMLKSRQDEFKYIHGTVRMSINVGLQFFKFPLAAWPDYDDDSHKRLFGIEMRVKQLFGNLIRRIDTLALNSILPLISSLRITENETIQTNPKLLRLYERVTNEQITVLLDVSTTTQIHSFAQAIEALNQEVEMSIEIRNQFLLQASISLLPNRNMTSGITIEMMNGRVFSVNPPTHIEQQVKIKLDLSALTGILVNKISFFDRKDTQAMRDGRNTLSLAPQPFAHSA